MKKKIKKYIFFFIYYIRIYGWRIFILNYFKYLFIIIIIIIINYFNVDDKKKSINL